MKINKINKILDAVYGKQIKGRWKKIIKSIIIILSVFFLFLFLLLNVGYNKKEGFFIKPPETKIEIKKGA